ncbi:FkbM family methyltransferase [Chloroflexota bacterium]
MSIKKYFYYLASIWKLLTGIEPISGVIQAFIRPGISQERVIKLRQYGLSFNTRGGHNIWSIKETFLDRFYEKFGTSIGEGWTVIDIGGGIGDFTIFVAAQHPKNVVYAFEPTPGSFTLLQDNLRLNQIDNAQVFPQAIWSQGGQVVIDTGTGQPGQFTSHLAEKSAAEGQKVPVPSLSLEEAFEVTGLGHCNLMKIDCEGAEYEILFNAPDEILSRVERIVMEYHDNLGVYTHTDLEEFLTNKGFAVKSYPNYVHSYLGYLYASR